MTLRLLAGILTVAALAMLPLASSQSVVVDLLPEELALLVGENPAVKLRVQNIGPARAIPLYIRGTYPLASFIEEEIADPDRQDIYTSGTEITLFLNPQEERTIHVQIYSTEPTQASYTVKITGDANGLTVYDEMDITLGFNPALDAGLSRVLLFVLLSAVVAGYYSHTKSHTKV